MTNIIITDEMREKVYDWLYENDGQAADWLDADWTRLYSLGDLLDYYCEGALDECINMFVGKGTYASDWNVEYFVKDGELYEDGDLLEMVMNEYDDTGLLDSFIQDVIDNPDDDWGDDLKKIVFGDSLNWEDMKARLNNVCDDYMEHEFQHITDDSSVFGVRCRDVWYVGRIIDALISTRMCGLFMEDGSCDIDTVNKLIGERTDYEFITDMLAEVVARPANMSISKAVEVSVIGAITK